METRSLLWLLAFTASQLSSVASAQTAPHFRDAVSYPAGVFPSEIRLADFNRDGTLDIAVCASGLGGPDGELSVFFGVGDGTFGERKSYPAQSQPSGLAVGEVTGDALLDIVMPDYSANAISVFRAVRGGRFAGRTDRQAGSGPTDAEFGDFDGDGILDLAVANFGSESVGIHRGLGHGRFESPTEYPETRGPLSVAVLDLDRDGIPDVVTGKAYNDTNYFGSTISVRLGRGDGTLAPSTEYRVGRSAGDIVAADFNEDGTGDLAVVCAESRSVTVLLGDDVGALGQRADYPTGDLPFRGDVGDLNRDGHADMAIGNHQGNTITIYPGKGDGTFGDRVDYPAGGRFLTDPIGIAIGDLNGDGWQDIVVANSSSETVSVLLNLGGDEATRNPLDSGRARMAPSRLLNSPAAGEAAPARLSLRAPLSGGTSGGMTFRIGLPSRAEVRLRVFDVHGREIARILGGVRNPGWSEMSWGAVARGSGKAPSGVYFAVLESSGELARRKFILVR